MEGIFNLKAINASGSVVSNITEHNVIVNGAKEALAKLISDGSDSSKAIKYFAVGTSGTGATVADTELGNKVYQNEIKGYTYPEVGQVCFSWKLGFSEANGNDIVEFGLVCEDGTLFSRKVRNSSVYKSDDLSFEGTWTIIF